MTLDVHGFAQHVDDFSTDGLNVARLGKRGQQNRKLIAAQTCKRVAFAQTLTQARADREQQFVAETVTERIVDDFEMVEIEAQYRQRLFAALALRQQQAQMVTKQRTIRQACQQIMISLVMHGFFGLLALGNILHHAIAADETSLEGIVVVLVHAGGGQLHRFAAPMHQTRAAHAGLAFQAQLGITCTAITGATFVEHIFSA